MKISTLRSRISRDGVFYRAVKNATVKVPGKKNPLTVKELWAECRADAEFYARVKDKEFKPLTHLNRFA